MRRRREERDRKEEVTDLATNDGDRRKGVPESWECTSFAVVT